MLPLTVAGTNLTLILILTLWLLTANFKEKFKFIFSNNICIASILFFFVHLVSLLWTEDMEWGLVALKKMLDFAITLPILFTIVKKDQIDGYIDFFLLAILISVLISLGMFMDYIPLFKNANEAFFTPFMSHVSFNVYLAFAFYLASFQLLFRRKDTTKRIYYFFLVVLISIDMFVTPGRAGQLGYFFLLFLIVIQYFGLSLRSFIYALSAIFIIVTFAYSNSAIFNSRAKLAYDEIVKFSPDIENSVGFRINSLINSFEIFNENPVIGVGVGDFPKEYNLINQKNSPNYPNSSNPHNMYLLILVQLGLFGLISMLYIFYTQIMNSIKSNETFRNIGIALSLFYLLIMFGESYLLGHYTTILFVFFSSFIYNNFKEP